MNNTKITAIIGVAIISVIGWLLRRVIMLRVEVLNPLLYSEDGTFGLEAVIKELEIMVNRKDTFYIRNNKWNWSNIYHKYHGWLFLIPKNIISKIESFDNKYKKLLGEEFIGAAQYKIDAKDKEVLQEAICLLENAKELQAFLNKCLDSFWYYEIISRFVKV